MWWVIRGYIWYALLIVGLGVAATWLPGLLNRVRTPIDYDHEVGDLESGKLYWLAKPPFKIGALVAHQIGADTEKIGFGRIVAVAGDVVELKGDRLLVGGNPVVGWRTAGVYNGLPALGPVRIPAHHVFIISDGHRSDSIARGPIAVEAVLGRVEE